MLSIKAISPAYTIRSVTSHAAAGQTPLPFFATVFLFDAQYEGLPAQLPFQARLSIVASFVAMLLSARLSNDPLLPELPLL